MTTLVMAARRYRLADFYELTKPRIAMLVVLTAVVGYLAGSTGATGWPTLAHLAIGTAMCAGAAGILNQVLERDIDARMRRTLTRPIPAGRISAGEGAAFGLAAAFGSCLYLLVFVGWLTALLAVCTLVSYLLVYTPLKRITPLNTIVGAVPGALPPVGGWAAARGDIGLEAVSLFAILFLWQLPHFLAIAWMYREDYARAGLAMLPVVDTGGKATGRHVTLFTLALAPISLAPAVFGSSGSLYMVGALVLGLAFLTVGVRMARTRTASAARHLLLASVVYLPLLLGLLVVDRVRLDILH
ncbi:protoheme IX farnesyltransferase [Candidatus Poribacteria bacterium]|jgi:heme o synthase|nr:protoheme IX farnesyltransferase [Candidatus Poribacteria bacterium]MBT5533186.1 protoheme IX farnesyltransferase [Candidatus Poribacteria bacterium]MBT5714957.1 protoheme IX farnesyltransferase [Candidatus Poribacteria bacterium]MBT7100696.1 protoheme IX farnesyltransferase [Candidatus Poribacteria bacterium]MBT7807093.1 protoheme IX farnesyltransferase [Candidatus Poribacteria bacterium]